MTFSEIIIVVWPGHCRIVYSNGSYGDFYSAMNSGTRWGAIYWFDAYGKRVYYRYKP